MSILEKFFKNKKGDIQHPLEKRLMHDRVYEYHHKKAVLEDGKLYDTDTSEKIFSYETDAECISLSRTKRRAYFLTPHGKWFSAEEETETESGITDMGVYRIQVTKTIFTYSNLRIEREDMIKVLTGKNDYELYKRYFGEVEEA